MSQGMCVQIQESRCGAIPSGEAAIQQENNFEIPSGVEAAINQANNFEDLSGVEAAIQQANYFEESSGPNQRIDNTLSMVTSYFLTKYGS